MNNMQTQIHTENKIINIKNSGNYSNNSSFIQKENE